MYKLISIIFIISCTIFFKAKGADVDFRWAKNYGGSGADQGRVLVTGPDGYIYFTGNFSGTAGFPAQSGALTLSGFGSGEDIYVAKADSNGNVIWAKQMGGTGHDRGTAIALDDQGHLYVGGYFSEKADFNPAGGGMFVQSGGYSDGFLMQMDTSGQVNWVRQVKGKAGNDHVIDITVDRQGDILATGLFLDSADFGAHTTGYVIRPGAATYNAFVGKYNDRGDLIWVKTFGGQQYSSASGISVTTDRDNAVYVTGAFSGTVDFNPGPGVFPLTGGYDYILKLTSSGDFVWASQMDVSSGWTGGISAIHVDTVTNSLYLCGSFEGRIDFDPGPARSWLTARGYTEDGFILKLDTSGSFQWVRQIEDRYGINAMSVVTDRLGRVYAGGYFMETAVLDPGPDSVTVMSNGGFDAYLLSLDTAGGFLWGRSFGGNGNECLFRLSVTEDFTINSTGLFSGKADFHIDRDTFAFVSSAGNHDIFLHQISVFSCKAHNVLINVNKDTLSITQDFVSYRWLYNGDTIPGATGKYHIATENGLYALAFVDENGCADTSKAYNVNNLDIRHEPAAPHFVVYPNPASETVYIRSAGPVQMILRDLRGSTLLSATGNTLQVGHLPEGMYFLQLTDPGADLSGTVVKLLITR